MATIASDALMNPFDGMSLHTQCDVRELTHPSLSRQAANADARVKLHERQVLLPARLPYRGNLCLLRLIPHHPHDDCTVHRRPIQLLRIPKVGHFLDSVECYANKTAGTETNSTRQIPTLPSPTSPLEDWPVQSQQLSRHRWTCARLFSRREVTRMTPPSGRREAWSMRPRSSWRGREPLGSHEG